MTAASSESRTGFAANPPMATTRSRIDVWVLIGLAVAALVAWAQPGDRVFNAMTFGQPALRAIAIVAMGVCGLMLMSRTGLSLKVGRGSIRLPLVVAVAVALTCAAADWAMPGALQPSYVRSVTVFPVLVRTPVFMLRAFNEAIVYRLFLGQLLVCALGRIWRTVDDRPAPTAILAGLALAQAINVGFNVSALAPLTPLAVIHDAVRYFAPGVVWGWLFWRRGFEAVEFASVSTHAVFQPIIGLGL